MVQNHWWTSGYNIGTVPLAASVLYASIVILSPAISAILILLSTVIVAVNARFFGEGNMTNQDLAF
ncbi:hypothetical protein [Rhodohalobacter sp.]|uniref:hypothetical protein n=1 Tax=Rhodohalobacter sp. TaxID=1974210 RepID=UPI002ACD8BB8|nr:hypothetical protein [Rhodohalobacter sp.]MDZ7755788.1 hypothetical protein [Rhodohalobacter sp.]